MRSLIVACNAVIPFLIYLGAGYAAKRTGIVEDTFLKKLNTMNFRLFYPFVMFNSFYQIEPGMHLSPKPIAFSVVMLGIVIFLSCLLVPRFVKEDKKRSVVIQAIYRSNAVLYALPLSESVFQQNGVVICAMVVAVIVPIYNITAVILLERYSGKTSSPAKLIRDVLKNPLIIGAMAGVVFLLTGVRLPQAVLGPVSAFGNMATPLALFVLGGSLVFGDMKKNRKYLTGVSLLRLVLVPAVVLMVSCMFAFSPAERFVLFAVFATPIAVASYPMAQNMGGDGELAGQLVFVTTVLSIITLFIWIFLQSSLNMLGA
ncbi:MAG: AEC family transporter [Eubacterium sp.]|nr:AEC family transporter [Eubacterium sp.]